MTDRDRSAARRARRSSIAPTTNITLLGPVRLEEDAAALLSGQLTSEALPAYLHEATHHACFFSPVGLALALLNMRARRRWLLLELRRASKGPGFRDLDALDVLDDYLRYDVLTGALGPLAEGLATFAEFDALPGSSLVATDLMVALAGHFILSTDPSVDPWATLRATLLHERSTYRFASRKTSLFAQSIDPARGGYLAGYLVVKGLWRAAASNNKRLQDSDLFLNMLMIYLYADFGLVAHLLDPETGDTGAAAAIVNYLAGRLRDFIPSISDDWLDAIEAGSSRPFVDEGSGDLATALDGMLDLGNDATWARTGRERLTALYAELEAEAQDDGGVLGALPARQLWTLAERQLLLVGSLDVELDINERGFVRVWRGSKLISSGPGVSGAREHARTAGALAIFINPWRWGRYMAYTASIDGRTVLAWFSRDLTDAIKEQFLAFQTDPAMATFIDEELAERLELRLLQDRVAEVILSSTREHLSRWSMRMYATAALSEMDPALWSTTIEQMSTNGLVPVLGSLSLVRALAWLSLNWMLHVDGSTLADAFREAEIFHGAGGDLWSVVDEIAQRAEDAIGEPLVRRVGGHVVCTV